MSMKGPFSAVSINQAFEAGSLNQWNEKSMMRFVRFDSVMCLTHRSGDRRRGTRGGLRGRRFQLEE